MPPLPVVKRPGLALLPRGEYPRCVGLETDPRLSISRLPRRVFRGIYANPGAPETELEDAGSKSPCAQYYAFLVVNQPGLCGKGIERPLPPDNDRELQALAAFSLRGSVLSERFKRSFLRASPRLERRYEFLKTLETWFDELGYRFLRNRRDSGIERYWKVRLIVLIEYEKELIITGRN